MAGFDVTKPFLGITSTQYIEQGGAGAVRRTEQNPLINVETSISSIDREVKPTYAKQGSTFTTGLGHSYNTDMFWA